MHNHVAFHSLSGPARADLEHCRCNRVYTPWVNRDQTRSDLWRSSLHIYENHRPSWALHGSKTRLQKLSIDVVTSPKRISVQTKTASTAACQDWWLEDMDIIRCESPSTLHCVGDCLPSPTEKPHVVSARLVLEVALFFLMDE